MALIAVSGQTGCRHEEAARLTAQLLRFELVNEARLRDLLAEAFSPEAPIPDKAYPDAAVSILARLATEHHLVVVAEGAELLLQGFPGALRVAVVAPESRRLGTLMLDHRLDRPAAKQLLRSTEAERRLSRKRRFGRATASPESFDLLCNSEFLEPEQIAELIRTAAGLRGLEEQGLLAAAAEAHLQFLARLKLARHGIAPPGNTQIKHRQFMHPSEEIFANLLDFYRVAWDYEPRSFPLRWSNDGKALEAFTPDFYLPEFDLYVELTTMKQSLVTKKNRKIKLLKTIYPEINIQVFYQKDLENLVFKYGLAERLVKT